MKDRVIYGALLMAGMLLCVLLSPVTRVVFFAAAGILCMYEYCARLRESGIHCAFWALSLFLISAAVLALLGAETELWCAVFAIFVFLSMSSGIFDAKISVRGAVYTAAGLAYPGVFFAWIISISVTELWLKALTLACLSVWVCDSAAMFGGKRFGKHKLAPAVSPNKTVEGSICGAVSAAAVGVIVWALGQWIGALSGISLWLSILICVIASTVGQVGDLSESLIKRMIGIKDFSDLIPGHGGMFDRADSLLFAIPTAYLILRLAGM